MKIETFSANIDKKYSSGNLILKICKIIQKLFKIYFIDLINSKIELISLYWREWSKTKSQGAKTKLVLKNSMVWSIKKLIMNGKNYGRKESRIFY